MPVTWFRATRGVAAVAVVAAGLVASTVTVAARFPDDEWLEGFARRSVVGIAPGMRPLVPLAGSFIERVLGPGDRAGRGAPAAVGGQSPESRYNALALGRATVEHAAAGHMTEAGAYEIERLPFTARTSAPAPTDGDAPRDCVPAGGVWYRYRADRSSGLLASTYGSTQATAIAAYRRDGSGGLVLEGCDADPRGNAQTSLGGVSGETYLFRVASIVGAGRLAFNLDRTGETFRVSQRTDGSQVDRLLFDHAVSGDGRFVVFATAGAFAAEDSNGAFDVYVHDRGTAATTLVSMTPDGRPGNGDSEYTDISGDGRFVAFTSEASDLVPSDRNDSSDVFVRDLVTGSTVRASLSSSGAEGSGPPGGTPSLAVSDDGRWVVFTSGQKGLAPGDFLECVNREQEDDVPDPLPFSGTPLPVNECRQVFVRDLWLGTTTRLSVEESGRVAPYDFSTVDMSPDGRFVIFATNAALVGEDSNGYRDVYLRDRDTDSDGVFDEPGATLLQRVSLTATGGQADGHSGGTSHRGHATVSADGRYVSFLSDARNLTANDLDPNVDVFLRDRVGGTTVLVTGPQRDEEGRLVDRIAHHGTVSADGRYVAFGSEGGLYPEDGDSLMSVYVWDRDTGHTVGIAVSSEGEEANGASREPQMAAGGRHVVFLSSATNLVEPDTNSCFVQPTHDPTGSFEPGHCVDLFVHVLPADS